MTDEKFYQMECMEEEVQEAYEKLEKAEEYQNLIKRDLRRLDSERQAYGFRKIELRHLMKDTRSMTIVCATAVIFCLLLLVVLQYAFSFDVKIGYLAAGGIGALAITAIFLKYNDAVRELSQVESGISRLIRLQNTVKIRYVNNTHLLDYLYMKYNVKSLDGIISSISKKRTNVIIINGQKSNWIPASRSFYIFCAGIR